MYRFGFSSVFCVLCTILLLGCAEVKADNVAVNIFGSSSEFWLAVQPVNDNGATTQIELMDGFSAAFAPMAANPGWGFYTFTSTSGSGFVMPISLRLSDASGSQITVQLTSIVPGATVDTGATFASSPSTTAPTSAPSTSAPTPAPTSAPTSAPTPAPTSAPTTAPTPAPTSAAAPPSTDLCAVTPTSSEPLKILVPLYVYPGAAWDALITAASSVKIIAIINPNSGPLPSVDSAYSTYMTKLQQAGIEIIGYVHTSYGARATSAVEADIDLYASNYPLVTGIFFDEASPAASEIPYYTEIYQHSMSKGYTAVILNPGTQPDQGYFAISTSIVIFEEAGASFAQNSYSSWVTCAPSSAAKPGYKYHFSGIAHSTSEAGAQAVLAAFNSKGVGLVYVTDGAAGCCTYNNLVSYFAQEASMVQALN
jgi:hypothetical protein